MTSSARDATPKQAPRRKDGDRILCGHGGYLDDVDLPGLLHASILRSPHAHARIVGIDKALAETAPGVKLVMLGHELASHIPRVAGLAVPPRDPGFTVLATDEVIYEGQPVAVVVAESLAESEAALKSIQAEYEPLPAVTTLEEAVAENAPLVFPDWGTNEVIAIPFMAGDADAQFSAAPRILEDEIRIQRYHTAPMETRGYIADWGPSGRLTLYASTQMPHPVRTLLSATIGVPETDIRIVTPRVGGGFGHKFAGFPEEGMVAVLSRLLERPVQWLETREESFLVGAREYRLAFSVAYNDSGRMLALRARIEGDVGILGTGAGWGMVPIAGLTLPGPYKIGHYEVHAVPVVTNKPGWSGAIGYGKEAATLLLERAVELIAEDLGLDSIEVRRINFVPPNEFPYWVGDKRLDSGDYDAALSELLELGGVYEHRRRRDLARENGQLVGVGVAFELCPEAGDAPGSPVRAYDTSTVRVDPLGTVTVLTGVSSSGTGNETGIAQLVAEEFGIGIDSVAVQAGDTDVSPYGFGTFSSRGLTVGGGAAVLAAREIKAQMAQAAGTLLGGVPPDELTFDNGLISAPDGTALPFGELAHQVFTQAGVVPGLGVPQLEATRTWGPDNIQAAPDEQGRTSLYPTYPYSAHMAVVEVDTITGVVRVNDYAVVHDCGVVINQAFVDGQILGSIAFGIGGALWEELRYDDGHLVASTFKHYLVPRTLDLPHIRLGQTVTPSPFTILGTKGAGESGVGGSIAAIANAVNDAISPLGIRVHEMPLSASRLVDAMEAVR